MVKNMTKRMFSFIALMMLMMATSLSAHAGVVTVKQSANGQVAVDKTNAAAGETVTITVTPDAGYYTTKDLIKAEKTVGGGSAQAPGLKADGPGVGSFVTVNGEPVNTVDKVNTYTFVMPEDPYGVQVSAEFKACTVAYSIKWGEGDNWDPVKEIAMTESGGKWSTAAGTDMTANSQFKVYKNVSDGSTLLAEEWLGANATVTQPTQEITVGDGPNIHVGRPGIFSFSYDPATQQLTVTSEFLYNVTVNASENGTVALEGDETLFAEGETVNLTITPNPGYEVGEVYYMNGTQKVVIDGSSFTMPDYDVEINATFTAINYTITVTQGENGTIAADKETAHVGDVVTLTNTPNEDCVFVSYTVTDAEGNPITVENNQFTMPASNVTVTATFRAYTVNYLIKWGEGSDWNPVKEIAMEEDGAGKWITAQKTDMTATSQFKVVKDVRDGETLIGEHWLSKDGVTISSLPATIEGLAEGGENMHFAKDGSYNFTYDPATKTLFVTGEIVPDKYAITITEPQNGTVTADKTEAAEGETVTLTITPAGGYEIDAISVMNGETAVEVTADNTFVMPAAPVTVTVTFKAIGYTITVTQGENGTVAADKETAHVGDVVTLTNAPNEDCVFVSYTVTDAEGNPITVENNQFTMPASNVTVTATFKAYTVTYSIKWGEGADWDPVKEIAMEEDGAGKWISTQATEMTATSQFKVYKYVHDGDTFISGHWLSKDGVSISSVPATIEGLAEGGENMLIAKAGSYNFTYDPATKTLFVTGEVAPDKYAITITEPQNGTVTADKTEAAEGETVTLTITPAEGYEIDAISVMNGETAVEVTADNTFVMPAAPVTVTVTFKKTIVVSNLSWTVTPADGGTVVIKADDVVLETSPAQVEEGKQISVVPTPAEGYELDEITVMAGDVEVEVSDDYTFTMPASNITVTVTFKSLLYELEGVAFTSERQWATYYNGTKNLALPEGVKAYVVNSVVNDAVDITEINYIPAGVGVLLYSENAAEQIFTTLYTGETGAYTSKLVGSDEAQEIAEGAGYVLYNNFFTLSEGGTVAAHRCYLPVNVTTNAPRVLRIGYDGSVTAIETLIATGNVTAVKYVNMSGVTSDMPFRGVNIAVVTFTDGTTKTVKFVK